ncbi:APC family permease [Umezawaea sp.]|uniref:APC family permease n=1 Tax=Umezawaea sp. TaxID=1955258 RepID=UPI002ED522DB
MTSIEPLTVSRGAALYIGALLGPGLLLLPGLASAGSGPASILAWVALLAVSGLLAVVFAALGVQRPSATGVRAYAEDGLGHRAGQAVSWCFLAGVVTGAPIVSYIGGTYLAGLVGADGPLAPAVAAAGLLTLALVTTSRGVRTSTTVQLGLVVLLVVIVAVAVVGSAPAADADNWTPFAPHGWTAIGSTASVLVLSFVGWEAVAPLTARFADPRSQLPRVIGIAFGATGLIYLALATATISVLGPGASPSTPVTDLLTTAIGPAGAAVAAVGAAVLTLGGVNAYLTGAAALARSLTRPSARPRGGPPDWLLVVVVASACALLGLGGAGVLAPEDLVTVPSTLFLVVYLGCTAAAWRLLTGPVRAVAAVAFAGVLVIIGFSGCAVLLAALVAAGAAARPGPRGRQPALTP